MINGITTQQALEQRNRRLKSELEIVRQEREIVLPLEHALDRRGRLKAATRFFAKENQ